MKSPADQRVCVTCLREPFLSAQIEKDGIEATCSYCEERGSTFAVGQIAASIEIILADFYYRTDHIAVSDAPEGQSLIDVIRELTEMENGDFAEDVRCVLAEQYSAEWEKIGLKAKPFSPEAWYAKNRSANAWDFESDWSDFENNLKTETRYFNRQAEDTLASIFDGIDQYRTVSGRSIVVEAGPATDFARLYRAREFQSESELRKAMKRPDLDVGPPPKSKAVAGRMNAAGIAVFYGATDPEVALAEVRPPVGSQVLIGCFDILRPLKLLDLSALDKIADDKGSLFDDSYRDHLKRGQFLRGLASRLSKPVMPNDEPLEYLPTQAIADFLATVKIPPLDGIIYASVQGGGQSHLRRPNYLIFGSHGKENYNVVLFHKAARVRCLDEGAEISVSANYLSYLETGPLDDGPNVQYTVWIGSAGHPPATENAMDDATLKCSSLEVRYVKLVEFDTRAIPIIYRSKKKPELETGD